jgi:hypothetical protein
MQTTVPAGFDELLSQHSDEVAELTRCLCAVILRARPELRERVYRGWHGLGFHHPVRGYVAAIFPRDVDVMVGFEHGADLPDPHGLLEGAGRRLRYLRFTPAAGVPTEEHLEHYIDLAVHG